ncbi:MAG TPA: hypothetical protein VIV11_12770 [Kofleriaceae bacterium]
MSRIVALALVLLLLAACAEEAKEGPYNRPCSLTGDCPLPDIDVAVIEEALLSGATLELCVDDACSSGALPEPPQGADQSSSAMLTGAFNSLVRLERVDASISVVIHFFVTSNIARVDGEIYVATLRHANGATLAAASWRATYYSPRPECPDDCARRLDPL